MRGLAKGKTRDDEMRNLLSGVKVFGTNKYELYVSFLVVAVALQNTAYLPHDFRGDFVWTCATVVAFFCALNAARDVQRMNALEQVLTIVWFMALLCCVPLSMWRLWEANGVYPDR